MAASFTSWSDMAAEIKDKLAKRDLTVSAMTGPDGSAFTYRSIGELQKLLGFVESRAALESSSAGVSTRRTYASAARS